MIALELLELLLETALPLLYIEAVVAAVELSLAVTDLNTALDDFVEEIAVMTDGENSPFEMPTLVVVVIVLVAVAVDSLSPPLFSAPFDWLLALAVPVAVSVLVVVVVVVLVPFKLPPAPAPAPVVVVIF